MQVCSSRSPRPFSSISKLLYTAFFVACIAIVSATASMAQNKGGGGLVDPNLPAYHAQPVPQPHDRGYLLPDGSVQIIGFDDMAGMVAKLSLIHI